MKKFNKSIQIEIQVDAIASKLLGMINPEEVNREGIAFAAIALALNSQAGLGPLYNALNGLTNDLDNLSIGMTVNTTAKCYTYEKNGEGYSQQRREIGKAEIIDLDIYRGIEPIQLQYYVTNSKGSPEKETTWVALRSITLPQD